MDIKEVLLQWSINFLTKKTSGGAATLANKSSIKNENKNNLVTNCTNQFIENSGKEKCTHLL